MTSVQNGIPLVVMTVMNVLTINQLNNSKLARMLMKCDAFFLRRYKQNQRTTKMLVMLFVVYVVCVTPEKLFYILYIYEVKKSNFILKPTPIIGRP